MLSPKRNGPTPAELATLNKAYSKSTGVKVLAGENVTISDKDLAAFRASKSYGTSYEPGAQVPARTNKKPVQVSKKTLGKKQPANSNAYMIAKNPYTKPERVTESEYRAHTGPGQKSIMKATYSGVTLKGSGKNVPHTASAAFTKRQPSDGAFSTKPSVSFGSNRKK